MSIKLTPNQLRRLASVPRPETRRRKRPSTNKLPVPREKEVLRAILALLKDLGIPAWRTNSGLQAIAATEGAGRRVIRSAPPGTPDIIGWLPNDGRFLGIEVKRPGERPTPIQIERMRQINRDGGVAFWANNVGACSGFFAIMTKGIRVEMDEIGNFCMTLA